MAQDHIRSRLDSTIESVRPKDGVARTVWDVVAQSIRDLFVDSGPQWAAAVAFYVLLSAVPLLILAASIATFFVSPEWAAEQLKDGLGDFAPQGEGEVERMVDQAIAARGQVSAIAFAGLLWTGTRVFSTLTRAMNIAFDSEESYGFLKRTLIDIVMVLTLGVFFVLALVSGMLSRWLWGAAAFLPSTNLIVEVATSIVRAGMLLLAFFLIYRFVPRDGHDWRPAFLGAVVATILFLIAHPVFSYYVQQFGNYSVIYGQMGVVIVVLIWVWISLVIMMIGAELAAHTQAMVIDGMPREEVARRHANRSPDRHRPSSSRHERHDRG
jgi:membrane protein